MTVEVIRAASLGVAHGFLGRRGGVSTGVVAGLNVGAGSGDDPAAIAENVRRACDAVLPGAELSRVYQVHSAEAVVAEPWPMDARPRADALVSDRPGLLLGIVTADCAPILLADAAAGVVGAAHAGWRGLASGVLEATIDAMAVAPDSLQVWMGPAIGARVYEVGEDVYRAFPGYEAAFRPTRPGHWLLDLYAVARRKLAAKGVKRIHGGGFCTYTERERFFSYRRDRDSRRIAAVIYIESPTP